MRFHEYTPLRRGSSRLIVLPCRALAVAFVDSKCLTVNVSTGGPDEQSQRRGLTLEEEKAFKDAFAAVMVDTSLGFNVFGAWKRPAPLLSLSVSRGLVDAGTYRCSRSVLVLGEQRTCWGRSVLRSAHAMHSKTLFVVYCVLCWISLGLLLQATPTCLQVLLRRSTTPCSG